MSTPDCGHGSLLSGNGIHPEGIEPMVDFELKRKVRISREEAARRLIALGQALAASEKPELNEDGNSIQFAVAAEVQWEFELEVDDDETELEIEMKWSNAPRAEIPQTAAQAAAEVASEG